MAFTSLSGSYMASTTSCRMRVVRFMLPSLILPPPGRAPRRAAPVDPIPVQLRVRVRDVFQIAKQLDDLGIRIYSISARAGSME